MNDVLIKTSRNSGTVQPKGRCSPEPRYVGTYIHEAYGHDIITRVYKAMYQQDVDGNAILRTPSLDHVIPGRVINPHFPLFAATPDGFSVSDETYLQSHFTNIWRDATRPCADPDKEYDDYRRTISMNGAPRISYEIKTLHNKQSYISRNIVRELCALVNSDDRNEARERAVQEITKRL